MNITIYVVILAIIVLRNIKSISKNPDTENINGSWRIWREKFSVKVLIRSSSISFSILCSKKPIYRTSSKHTSHDFSTIITTVKIGMISNTSSAKREMLIFMRILVWTMYEYESGYESLTNNVHHELGFSPSTPLWGRFLWNTFRGIPTWLWSLVFSMTRVYSRCIKKTDPWGHLDSTQVCKLRNTMDTTSCP